MDKPVFGTMRWGYFRWNVVNPETYEFISKTKEYGGIGIYVTRYQRTVGETKDCDSTTGWWPVTYEAVTAVVGVWSHRGGSAVRFAPGTYCEYDAVFYTLDGVARKELLVSSALDSGTVYYTVMSVEDKYDDAGGFAFRVCQCKRRSLLKAEAI